VLALPEREGRSFAAGLHGAAHALLAALPLLVLCHPTDVGCECTASTEEAGYQPRRLLLYDRQPGGTGIAAQVLPWLVG
jgi:ATP-dependent helicase YprA (DUF1998 family)